MGMGNHQTGRRGVNVEWYTPPAIVTSLGEFDLDPCAPIDVAYQLPMLVCYTKEDDGLLQPWSGRVWCNPPYGRHIGRWLRRCAEHGNATALVFARTETLAFHEWVWPKAHAVLFLRGRIRFISPTVKAARDTGGAPSVLIAYNQANGMALARSGLDGYFRWLK